MPAEIHLTVITGPHRNEDHVFASRTRCMAGRAPDCAVRLSGEIRDMQISRHHCLLDIDPPHVRVADLGSRNGTYVNGKPVSLCGDCATGNKPAGGCAGSALRDGDILTIGGSSFRVSITGAEEGAA